MKPNDFIIWLGGYLDGISAAELTETQTAVIKTKLATVFNKVTPPSIWASYTTPRNPDFPNINTTC